MHAGGLCSLNAWLCIFKHQDASFGALEVVVSVELLAHRTQGVGPTVSKLLQCFLLVGVVAQQSFPRSEQEDVRMWLAACEPCIVSTDDALGKGSKEFRVAGGLDLVIPALAARSNTDGDLVLVQVLYETRSPCHLRNLLERFQKHIVAVLEERVDVKRTIRAVQLTLLGGRPKRR